MKPLYYLVFAGARFYPRAAGDLKAILRADLVSHDEAVRRAEAAREADEDWGSMPEYAWAAVTTVYDDLTFKRTYRKYGNDDAPEAEQSSRRVACLCAPGSTMSVRAGRHVRTVTHSLLCPVTQEHGTADEEFDDGPVVAE